jgi:importin subunit beta-1
LTHALALQLDYESIDYIANLREGILEAHTGIITGFKKTERGTTLFHFYISHAYFGLAPIVQLLATHAPAILELVQKVLADDNSGEPLDKLAYGVIGDLADAFPAGELKPLLLAEWIATSLVLRKGYDKETKTTVKWAREVKSSRFKAYCRFNSLRLQMVKRATV